jgi:cofilin
MMKVNVREECLAAFEKLKMEQSLGYLVYNINKEEEIVVDCTGPKGASFEEFAKKMPADDLRYGVFDLNFDSKDGMHMSKIIFVLWSPDGTKPKRRMLFASSKDLFTKHLVGIAKDIQAVTQADLDRAAIIKDLGF